MVRSHPYQSCLTLDTEHHRGYQQATEWARELLASKEFVVFDSETTGLGRPCNFVEVAALGADGEILFESLVKPRVPIELGAKEYMDTAQTP